jgi:hypothetical protein
VTAGEGSACLRMAARVETSVVLGRLHISPSCFYAQIGTAVDAMFSGFTLCQGAICLWLDRQRGKVPRKPRKMTAFLPQKTARHAQML